MTSHISKPKVKLSGIEYLLISIQSNPGKSQRWHLRRKFIYQHGKKDPHNGGTNCGYFTNSSYRNVLWTDRSYRYTRGIKYSCSVSVNGVFAGSHGHYAYRSPSCEMHLTRLGWKRANSARAKLGLEPLECIC